MIGIRPWTLNLRTAGMESAQFVPDTMSATVLFQMPAFDQRAELLLERVAACAGQLDVRAVLAGGHPG